jgi:hypothetical protein
MAEGRPLRSPTPLSERWEWWERAVQGERPDVSESEPQVGYYKVRKFRYGRLATRAMASARVWMEPQDIDSETGELLSDEIIRMGNQRERGKPMDNVDVLSKPSDHGGGVEMAGKQ